MVYNAPTITHYALTLEKEREGVKHNGTLGSLVKPTTGIQNPLVQFWVISGLAEVKIKI